MSLRTLPEARTFDAPQNLQWDAPSDIVAKWAEMPMPRAADSNTTISIFDQIGEGIFSEGITPKRIAAALRSIGDQDVTVQINSPGGNLFDGLAIYNLLRGHPQSVRVEVLGLAASAASVVAMAGDEIAMSTGSFMFVHNAWGAVVGNRHDMRDAVEVFEQFDDALVDVYEARSGLKRDEIAVLMDKESFLGASAAVEKGFADSLDTSLDAGDDAGAENSNRGLMARRKTEAALCRAGFTRDARTELMIEMGVTKPGQRDATGNAERDAGKIEATAVQRLIATVQRHQEGITS